MAERLLLAIWLFVLPFCHVGSAQTAQEILERTSRAMEPPISFRVNGNSCLVLKKKLADESLAIRMEFGRPASLVRIETASGSYELYPKSKSAIDLGFMGTAANSQLSDVLGLLDGGSRPSSADALQLTSETEFEGKQCWKITQSAPDKSNSPTDTPVAAEVGTPSETAYYIDKLSDQLVGIETSRAGKRILLTKIDDVEKVLDIAKELFVPPADFAIRKPQSIVEYLSTRESLIRTQELLSLTQDLKNRSNALQAQSAAALAAAKARTTALRRSTSRMTYALPILGVCMMVFILIGATLSQRRAADKWKQVMNDPAAAQSEIAKIMNATNLPLWTRFTRAPLVLKAFVIYSVCALVVGLVLPFFLPFGTYSSVAGIRFLAPLLITYTALSRLELRRTIYGMAALLAFFGAIGLFQFLAFQSVASILPNSSRRGALIVVFDIVMPIAWALLLMSPSMLKWLRAKSDDEVRVHQIAMTDLLYFMFVASLAMIASLTMIRMTN